MFLDSEQFVIQSKLNKIQNEIASLELNYSKLN